jgi:putative copper resistance protein D
VEGVPLSTLYYLSVWLHILAAALWAGGMLFLVLVLLPVVRQPEHRSIAGRLTHLVGVRYRNLGWLCFGLLVASGITNLLGRGVHLADLLTAGFWQTSFGQTLAVKLFFVAAIFLLSGIHDFVVGPRATAAWQANPGSPEAMRLRRQAVWYGRVNLLLSLVVIFLAVALVRGGLF